MFSYQIGTAAGPAGPLWRVADGRKKREASMAEAGELAVQQLLARDATYLAKVRRVRRYQARLRGQLSARGWQAYLQLEEAEVARWAHAFERVARWALVIRRRAQRRRTP